MVKGERANDRAALWGSADCSCQHCLRAEAPRVSTSCLLVPPDLQRNMQGADRRLTRRLKASTAALRCASLTTSACCSCSTNASISATLPYLLLPLPLPGSEGPGPRGILSSRCTSE